MLFCLKKLKIYVIIQISNGMGTFTSNFRKQKLLYSFVQEEFFAKITILRNSTFTITLSIFYHKMIKMSIVLCDFL